MPRKLPLSRVAANLLNDIADLRHAGSANGVPFRFQPAARIHGLGSISRSESGRGARPALAARNEAEILKRDDLGNCEAVMQFTKLNVGGSDSSHLVSLLRSRLHGRESGD